MKIRHGPAAVSESLSLKLGVVLTQATVSWEMGRRESQSIHKSEYLLHTCRVQEVLQGLVRATLFSSFCNALFRTDSRTTL